MYTWVGTCMHGQACVFMGMHVCARADVCAHRPAYVYMERYVCGKACMCTWASIVRTGVDRCACARADIFLCGQTCVFMGMYVLYMGRYMAT